jgi:uncharacterized protein (TIGR02246 family)
MTTDEAQIRTLIEQWATAVHAGDLDGVLADHADDIVMFDVPPPQSGVRGIGAYRETWLPFIQWQAQGALFEIESLDITAGTDVAFAHALLRCGTPENLAKDPGHRLRLTLGLRKEEGRWTVSHEHHSFPSTEDPSAEHDIRTLHEEWFAATARKDLDKLMSHIADDVISYEREEPLQYVGVDNVREVCDRGLTSTSGAVTWTVPDLKILIRDDLAITWGFNQMHHEAPDGTHTESWSRGTRIFQRRDNAWLLIHQHVSFPLNPTTGQATTTLRP